MPKCSICVNVELAETINKMLYAKMQQSDIATQTGVSKSTVGRHANACFLTYRALRNKIKTSGISPNARIVVSYPTATPEERTYGYGESTIAKSELRQSDIILTVVYDKLDIKRLGNPRACAFDETTFESFLAAAQAEDLERAEAKLL